MNETLQLKYTLDEFQLQIPYHAKVIQTDVTRAIPTFIPEIREESTLAIGEALKPISGKGTVPLEL